MVREPTITPILRYRDVSAAALWLCEAFGFEQHNISKDLDGGINYVSLRLGENVVLICPAADSVLDALMVQPDEIGGASTQTCYITVEDTDDHCAHAKAVGAQIVLDAREDENGRRFYSCRDPEGHLWSFGTQSFAMARELDLRRKFSGNYVSRRATAVVAALAVFIGGWVIYDTRAVSTTKTPDASEPIAIVATRYDATLEQLRAERKQRLAAETSAKDAVERLAEARTAGSDLQKVLQGVRADLSHALLAKEKVVEAQKSSEALVQEYRLAKDDAEKKASAATEEAAKARVAERDALAGLEREKAAAGKAAKAAVAALKAQEFAEQAARQAKESAKRAAGEAATIIARERTSASVNSDRLVRAERDFVEAQKTRDIVHRDATRLKAAIQAERRARSEAELKLAAVQAQLVKKNEIYLAEKKLLQETKSTLPATEKEPQELRPTPPIPVRAARISPERASEAPDVQEGPKQAGKICVAAVQGKIPVSHGGSTSWNSERLAQLCKGADISAEPARCFARVMSGDVDWGRGTQWRSVNALLLCGGTRNAGRTIDCFVKGIKSGQSWRTAIKRCRTG